MYSVESFIRAIETMANDGRSPVIREIKAFNFCTKDCDVRALKALYSVEWSSFVAATMSRRTRSQYDDQDRFCDKLHARLERFLQQHAAC